MESVPRASVDISTEEKPAPATGSKSFTLTPNKKVVYGLGLMAVVALGALGVASVSQDGSCEECMMACNDDGTAGTEDHDHGRRFLQGGPEAGANDPYGDCTNACMAPGGACDDGTAGTDGATGPGGSDSGGPKDAELCAPGCHEGWQGDNYCDEACNNEACNMDDGDCKTCAPGCHNGWQGDNDCDEACNVKACDMDDGDCDGAAGTEDGTAGTAGTEDDGAAPTPTP